MNRNLRGRLTDDEGAAEPIKTARETAQVGKRLGVENTLNAMGYRGPVGMEAFACGDADAALEFFRDTFAV